MIEPQRAPTAEVPPLFPVTTQLLDSWLGKDVELLVIDDVAVQLRDSSSHFNVYPAYSEEEE